MSDEHYQRAKRMVGLDTARVIEVLAASYRETAAAKKDLETFRLRAAEMVRSWFGALQSRNSAYDMMMKLSLVPDVPIPTFFAGQKVNVRLEDGSDRWEPAVVVEPTGGTGYVVEWVDDPEWEGSPFWAANERVRAREN